MEATGKTHLPKKIVVIQNLAIRSSLKTMKRIEKKIPPKRRLSPSIAEAVVNLGKYTTKPGGSASKGEVYGYSEAGKNRTSMKVIQGVYKDVYRASFIGFAPQKSLLLCFLFS